MVAKATVLGLAIGDAVGCSAEGMSPAEIDKTEWNEDGPIEQYEGEGSPVRWDWTEDTQMAMLLAESLIVCEEYDPEDAYQRLCRWQKSVNKLPELSRKTGKLTREALKRAVDEMKPWYQCGKRKNWTDVVVTSEAVPRAAVLGRWYSKTGTVDVSALMAAVQLDTKITHNHSEAAAAAAAFALLVAFVSIEPDKVAVEQILRVCRLVQSVYGSVKMVEMLDKSVAFLNDPDSGIEQLSGLFESPNGVSNVVPAAICVWATNPSDFRRGVVQAVRMGGEADTRAALVGALIATTHGVDAIPPKWARKVEASKRLKVLDRKLGA